MSGPSFQILPSTPELAVSFQGCLDEVARERQFLLMSEGPTVERLTNFIVRMNEVGNPQFVALQGGEVIGWCDIRRLENRALHHCGELGMGVKKSERGRGIGRKLLQMCVDAAWKRDFRKVQLTVFTHNTGAVELYRKSGFVEEGRLKHYAVVDGKSFDAHQMACFCPSGLLKDVNEVIE